MQTNPAVEYRAKSLDGPRVRVISPVGSMVPITVVRVTSLVVLAEDSEVETMGIAPVPRGKLSLAIPSWVGAMSTSQRR